MKKLVAILAIIGILLQTFSQVVIVAEYWANKDFIAKNLCENRDKPLMHCNGKCCLKKKLAKEGKDQAPSPRSQKNEQVINLFCNENKFEIKPFLFTSVSVTHYSYNELETLGFHHSVFHPPSA